jgi:hypothetical protein
MKLGGEMEFWISRLYWYLRNNWFEYLLLIIDVVFLLRYLLAKKLGWKVNRRINVQAMLVLLHLVLGALALWFDNQDVFYIITVIFLGPALLISWLGSGKDKDEPLSEQEEG